MAYISNVNTQTATPVTGLRGRYSNLVRRLNDNRIYARTVRELESLSDRELADLGLSRASLRDVARAAVYPK